MAQIYVSSTFSDLKEYREQVRLALRRLGHEDVAMEYYGAAAERPLDRCLRDVFVRLEIAAALNNNICS